MVGTCLNVHALIHSTCSDEEHDSSYKQDAPMPCYTPVISPWTGFSAVGDVGWQRHTVVDSWVS